MLSKPSVKIWSGKDAQRIKRDHADRFVGSRFLITRKVDEEGSRIKARWCIQGHSDPDVVTKDFSGACDSPTMSEMSRALLLQIMVSNKWQMCLGDVKAAFLESGPLKEKYRPLYARQPAGAFPAWTQKMLLRW